MWAIFHSLRDAVVVILQFLGSWWLCHGGHADELIRRTEGWVDGVAGGHKGVAGGNELVLLLWLRVGVELLWHGCRVWVEVNHG